MDRKDETEQAYTRVDEALRKNNLEFSREGHKYTIPNFSNLYEKVVSMASGALTGMQFHATEIPYREEQKTDPKRIPEFMAVLHLDDETYTY